MQRMREFYNTRGDVDIKRHSSVSKVLTTALAAEDTDAPRSVEIEPGRAESRSPRERDVLRLLSEGLKNRERAETLLVSENTVKMDINAILSKLSLKNRTQAASFALLDVRAYDKRAS
jgi:DNA-binding NarL/FixJ family response regulator